MIKTAIEVLEQLMNAPTTKEAEVEVLRQWALSIINECANEVREEPWQITKEAVLAVKEQIQ